MRTYTARDIMDLDPCYTDYEMEGAFGGRERVTMTDVANSEIYYEDKTWVMVYTLPAEAVQLWVARLLEQWVESLSRTACPHTLDRLNVWAHRCLAAQSEETLKEAAVCAVYWLCSIRAELGDSWLHEAYMAAHAEMLAELHLAHCWWPE